MKTPQKIHTDICRKAVDHYFEWSIPDNAKVKIRGFVMLKELDDGKTFIVKRDETRKIYWFCVARTGRKVIGHYMNDIDHGLQCFARGDYNGIQVISA